MNGLRKKHKKHRRPHSYTILTWLRPRAESIDIDVNNDAKEEANARFILMKSAAVCPACEGQISGGVQERQAPGHQKFCTESLRFENKNDLEGTDEIASFVQAIVPKITY